jgi:hypothetical protein
MTCSALLAGSASVKLHCLSARIDPATTKSFGLTYRLSITTADSSEPPNGELAIASADFPYTHQGTFAYEDPTTLETFFFPFGLDIPAFVDQNANNFHDFYEVETDITGITTGEFLTDPDTGETSQLKATWRRGAGSPDGTLKLELPDFGLTFNHLFHILQYDGTLTYTSENKTITGQISAALNGQPDQTLNGAVSLAVQSSDKLLPSNGTWKNQSDGSLDFSATDPLQREGLIYDTFIDFTDWNLDSSVQDYQHWYFEIISPDANNNQIPDLVEDETAASGPSLAIRRTDNGLELTITGLAAAKYELQTADSPAGAWSVDQTITMTGTTEKISLTFPPGNKFYRLRVI